MELENIKRNSTSEIICNQIKEQIRTGSIKPGEKLPSERKLTEMLGVSRTSVREAIQALSFSGYLDVIQGKGAFVKENAPKYDELSELITKISDFSLASLMEVRVMLEGEFARLATLRATNSDIEIIDDCFEEMKKAESIKMFILKDLEFHLSIVKATHNPLMITLMNIFGELLHKETNEIIKISEESREQTIKYSNDLVAAIKEGASEEARKYMTEHIKNILIGIDNSR